MRLAFVSPPFAGHFNPLLALARTALRAGHDVDFLTGPRKFPVLERHGVRPMALQSIGDHTLEAIANTADPVGSNPFRLLAQFRENLRLLPAIRTELLGKWKADPPSLVVADSVAPIAGFVAEELGIPWITTIATPFSIETLSATPSYCGGWLPAAGRFDRFRDACGRTAVHRFKQTVSLLFRRELHALGLQRIYRADASEAIYSPLSVLGFGIRELEFERDWPASFRMIGPLIDAPEAGPALVMPPSRPRVLVSHGTHLLWTKRQLVEDVVALSRALPRVHFVISMGEPERTGRSGDQITDRVRVEPFVPYCPNLASFDAIIHHGGAGVTYAAILAALPSLVVPRDYDQFDYAARIVHHRLGLRVQSLGVKLAAESLERLLDPNQWPALTRFQQYARAYDPHAAFLEVAQAFGR